ncbi:MAG: hypothetical protein IT382_16565 [Deltaproteobacteria bacterium]|nr:hypothetical protein [Deltaproteobacteria bacterium]
MSLTPQALQAIEAAVKAAEQQTRGEIVVAVVEASDGYGGPRAAFSLVVALAATLVALAVGAPPWALAVAWPVAAALAWALSALPALKRALVPDDELDAEVMESAKAAFVDHGVHRTADRAGVLIYLSLLERRVLLLGDAGIHAVVGEEGWKAHVARIVESMKRGHPEELAAVVGAVGEVLAQHFPPTVENRNELSDAVRRS